MATVAIEKSCEPENTISVSIFVGILNRVISMHTVAECRVDGGGVWGRGGAGDGEWGCMAVCGLCLMC